MDHEQLVKSLRERLMRDSALREACAKIGARFGEWPVLRSRIADAVAGVVGEDCSDVRPETARLVDRLIKAGLLQEHPGGAYLRPAVPLDKLLDQKRKPPEPVVITFRPDVVEPAVPLAALSSATPEDADGEGDSGVELSPEEAVLIGLYTLHLERHRGLFSKATLVMELLRLFREWRLPAKLLSSRIIQRALREYLADEMLESVEEEDEGTYRLTERGLQDAKAAKSAWDERH